MVLNLSSNISTVYQKKNNKHQQYYVYLYLLWRKTKGILKNNIIFSFFKDNLTVLCKKSYVYENGYKYERKLKEDEKKEEKKEEKKDEYITNEVNFIGIVPY